MNNQQLLVSIWYAACEMLASKLRFGAVKASVVEELVMTIKS